MILVKVLLSIVTGIIVKEGCGATPLTLPITNADAGMCKLLLENFAEFQGEMFEGIPSPVEMALLYRIASSKCLKSTTMHATMLVLNKMLENSPVNKEPAEN